MSFVALPANIDALTIDALTLNVPAQRNRSGWTGRSQTVGLPGAETWMAKITIDGIATEEEEWPWRHVIYGLNGISNHFHLPVGKQRHPGGRPVVAADTVSGVDLPLTGMAVNTRILRAGQYVTLPIGNGRLVVLMADIVTDNGGSANMRFRPSLDRPIGAGAVLETAEPYVPMSLSDTAVGLDYAGGVAGRSFDLEEAR